MISVNSTCKKCNDYILNCLNCSILGCNLCESSYNIFSNSSNTSDPGVCVAQCPLGYVSQIVNSINRCIPCDSRCTACTNTSTNCTQCANGYYYYSNTCILTCPNLMIVVRGQCMSCVSPCATCSNNNTSYC